MPCTSCMTSYSLLRKEQACANCGFGFCSNCLKQSWMFPARAQKPLNVCASCFHQLTEADQRRKEKTRTPGSNGNWWGDEVLPPPSMRNGNPVMTTSNWRGAGGGIRSEVKKDPQATQSSTSTEALRARLEKLKEDDLKPVARVLTTQELEERFAALREVPVEDVRNPGRMFLQSETKEETASELIKRVNEERKLEEKWHPDRMLEDRYNRLCDVEKRAEPSEAADHSEESIAVPTSDVSAGGSRRDGDDFDISTELDAVKKALEKCDSIEKPVDPAKNHWKDDENDMKQILMEVKKLRQEDAKINRVLSRDLSDDSELDDDEEGNAKINEEVNQILKEAERAEEEAAKLVRVSQAENPPPPEEPRPNGSSPKKAGFFSRIFKR
uniref:FYVE-type domain-containing protein n=1 Tax=Steinernema glaseri TaxID=37863 RepID=A0A1I8AAX9_9BILA